jgi:tRNA A37 threonylcarbamoyladenosine synthetase subunit TsaC/SUA5/YrdC
VLHIDKIDVILDAGKLPITPPSTIIDLSNFTPKVLRVGSIATSDIEKILHKKVKV